MPLAPVIPLAPRRALRQLAAETADVPLPEVDSVALACLRIDWETAIAAADGNDYVAHLWALRQLRDDLAGLRSPRAALLATSQAIGDFIAEAAR